MRQFLRAGLLAVLLPAATVFSQTASEARITVDYLNPGLIPAHWVLTLAPDGSGHFHSERGQAPAENAEVIDAPEVDRDVRLSAAFAARVYGAARHHGLFNEDCDGHMKVAFQGWKTLSYSGPEGHGSCRFNYSRDHEIQALGDALVAAASSILEGARLEKFLQHDRLGLDRELEHVANSGADGRMMEIGAIRGILERLSEDPTVLERVRKRARQLLTRAGE